MRILVVSERWWPEGGGGELATHLITKLLANSGFKITVIHGSDNIESIRGVKMIYTELLSVRIKHRLWANVLLLTREKWFQSLIRKIDLVYIPRLSYPMVPYAKRLGKKVIVHLHDYQPISYNAVILSGGERGRLSEILDRNSVKLEALEKGIFRAVLVGYSSSMTLLARLMISEADKIVCVSKSHCNTLGLNAPELSDKLELAYNPLPNIPLLRKSLKLKEPTFLYLGGESYLKGFYILLKAVARTLRNIGIKVLVAGSMSSHGKRIATAFNRHYGNHLLLLGRVRRDVLWRYHSRSYALIFPSICEEPLPYAVIESMLAGTIPISSKVGGIPEIVSGTYAENFTLHPGDADDLADKLEEVAFLPKDELIKGGYNVRNSIKMKFRDNIGKLLFRIFSN